jgi:predicted nucleic acid-binding protein
MPIAGIPPFQVARERLAALAEGQVEWAIPWHCLHEFIGVVTHPRIYDPRRRSKTH